MQKIAALLLTAALTLTLLAGCSTAEDRSYLNDLHKAYANYFVDDPEEESIERTDAMDAKAQKVLGYLQSNLTVAEGTDLEDAATDLLENKRNETVALLGLDLEHYGYFIGVAEVPTLENGMYDKTQIADVAQELYHNYADFWDGDDAENGTVGYAIGKLGGKTYVVSFEAWQFLES